MTESPIQPDDHSTDADVSASRQQTSYSDDGVDDATRKRLAENATTEPAEKRPRSVPIA